MTPPPQTPAPALPLAPAPVIMVNFCQLTPPIDRDHGRG
jgi:hypothetical protein